MLPKADKNGHFWKYYYREARYVYYDESQTNFIGIRDNGRWVSTALEFKLLGVYS